MFTAYGSVGFVNDHVTHQGDHDATDVLLLPLLRHKGTEGHVVVNWESQIANDAEYLLSSDSSNGTVAFVDGEANASVALRLNPSWVDDFQTRDPVDVTVELTSAERGADLLDEAHTCVVHLLPGEGPRRRWSISSLDASCLFLGWRSLSHNTLNHTKTSDCSLYLYDIHYYPAWHLSANN